MKLVSIIVCGILLATTAIAKDSLLGFQKGDDGYNYELHVSTGVAWYHDHRQYQAAIGYQPDAVDTLALYIQTPIASYLGMDICFGGISPLGYVERTRPEFSLDKTLGNIEMGIYWAMSPYSAFGAMVGWRF